jgi:Lrp/AsnC ligand binding domain
VITAIVLVHLESDRIPEVAEAIADLEGVSEVYSVTGDHAHHGGCPLCCLTRPGALGVLNERFTDASGSCRPMSG